MHQLSRTLLSGFALATGLALGLAGCSSEPPPPNLVVVLLDTLRPDHLGCYGYERDTSPHLDALAAKSVVFEQAESVAPWTAPAVISLVTGLHPQSHGVLRFPNPGRLNERATTLAEVLRERGYTTGAFTEGGYAKGEFGLDQGFDVFPSNPGDGQTHMSNMLNPSRLEGNLDRALTWLRRARGAPFFMLFHTYEVHGPLRAPDEYVRRFDPEWDTEREHAALAAVLARWQTAQKIDRAGALLLRNHNFHCAVPMPAGVQNHMHQNGLLPEDGSSFYPETLQFLRDQYDAEIAYTDAQLERLWSALRELDHDDNTVIVVVSDHGEALGEHGIVGHGSRHFSEQLRVVFMVRAPHFEPGRVETPVGSLSLMPTVLELLGATTDAELMGPQLSPSLVPLMRDPTSQGPLALFGQGLSVEGGEQRLISIRTGNLRCVVDTESGVAQLFDLEQDPGELNDIAAEFPDKTRVLAESAVLQVAYDVRNRPRLTGEVGTAELDDATLKDLGDLGYIEKSEED